MEGDKVEQPAHQQNPVEAKEGDQKQHKKGEPREKKPRPERKNQYEYNSDLIDQNTVIPPLPKKNQILPKPKIQDIKEKENKIKEKIEKLIQKKKAIRAQNFKADRKNVGKGQQSKHDHFRNQINQAKELRQRLAEVKVERNALRDKLATLIDEAKKNNELLKQFNGSMKGSRQNIFQRLEELEHKLSTADLSKEEEKSLNAEITLAKRKIKEAESSGNIEVKLAKCEERKEELDQEITQIKKEKEPLEVQYTQIKDILTKKNAEIDGLKTTITNQSKEKNEEKEKNEKEWQKWKENKKVRIDKVEEEIQKLKVENSKIWEEFNIKKDQYWKQKQYIDFIQWQTKVKNNKIQYLERQKKRAIYEQRDKEREKQDQLKKYIGEIELCNFLVQYLQNLKKEEATAQTEQKKETKNAAELNAALKEDSQWKKEKGLEVLQSKKSKDDQEPTKKHKKNKKAKEQKKQEVFAIPFAVQSQFESLKLLAPSSLDEVDKKIQELRERQKLFERACQESVNEEDTKLIQTIKEKKTSKKQNQQKNASKTVVEDDFPTI